MSASVPYFSICVPQYERTEHFVAALHTLAGQTFRDFEVVVSDGGSSDASTSRIQRELHGLGLRHVFSRSPERLRYDANLRRAIGMSCGRWCLLMGNDDGFSDAHTLEAIAAALDAHAQVCAAMTNYLELRTKRVYRRALKTGIVDSGVPAAVRHYRSFSFVSGIVLDGPSSRALESAAVDGSEMYQMYLASALLAKGGRLLHIEKICIDKDLEVPGVEVDSFRAQARTDADAFVAKPLPLVHLARTVIAGVRHGAGNDAARRVSFRVALQLYCFTFPFWSVEWRRVLPPAHARAMYRRLAPQQVLEGMEVGRMSRAALVWLHGIAGWFGNLVPIAWFDLVLPRLYAFAKRVR